MLLVCLKMKGFLPFLQENTINLILGLPLHFTTFMCCVGLAFHSSELKLLLCHTL